MKKDELKSLKIMADEAAELLDEMHSDDFCAIDEDGAYTHDAMVINNRIEHLMRCLCVSHENQLLQWYDYGVIPSWS